ncbi:MAG: 2-dehydropantoate 2-reductase [Armatimonadetes bacterium]|nr:2-dehydropantoate 2-reductase [Armatimonadota bacterium]
MKIAVYGAGGVGAYFGGRLARAGADVSLIARGAHLEALRRDGLRVNSVLGDFTVPLPASDDPATIGPCDVVLFCVKSYDTQDAAARLGPLLRDGAAGEATAVISLQNGIDNEAAIAAVIGDRYVVGGVCYILSTITAPGVVTHAGGPGRMVFAEMDGTRSPRVERLLRLCEAASVPAEVATDIRKVLWEKYALIIPQAGLTATTRLPIGAFRLVPESLAMFRRLAKEVCAVAAAEGVHVAADTVARVTEITLGLPPGVHTSLHYDLAHGERMELEALHGALARLGRRHGVPVPMTEAVYAILRPVALRHDAAYRDEESPAWISR